MDLVAPIALVVSLISLIWHIVSASSGRQRTAVQVNHTSILEVEAQVATTPEVLRFHGIDDPIAELDKHGVTPAEFAYLLNSFTLGGTYYRTSSKPELSLKPGSYRHEMCCAAATQQAWPLLKRLIMPSPYRDHVDQLIRELAS